MMNKEITSYMSGKRLPLAQKTMLILVIGDIIGQPGREAVHEFLPGLHQQYGFDVVIANAENVAGGFGLTLKTAKELLASEARGEEIARQSRLAFLRMQL